MWKLEILSKTCTPTRLIRCDLAKNPFWCAFSYWLLLRRLRMVSRFNTHRYLPIRVSLQLARCFRLFDWLHFSNHRILPMGELAVLCSPGKIYSHISNGYTTRCNRQPLGLDRVFPAFSWNQRSRVLRKPTFRSGVAGFESVRWYCQFPILLAI